MSQDWKDALSSLRNSLDEPTEEFIKETKEEENGEKTQKNPIRIVVDKKGRNGKVATILEGFTIDQKEVEALAKQIKQKFGVGGSVREGEILIQGDYRDKVKKLLQDLNFKTS